MTKKIKIAFLCSAGGAPAVETVKAFGGVIDFMLITDRPCDVEPKMDDLGINKVRLNESCGVRLSEKICQVCVDNEIDYLISFFSRLLFDPLISEIKCLNVHPSLLPKYPGMGAEKKAFANKEKKVGATLHVIDEGVDTGPILLQSSLSINNFPSFELFKKAIYICKTKVTFLFIERVLNGKIDFLFPEYNSEFVSCSTKNKFNAFMSGV